MALPITVPYTFGTATTAIPLTNLDSDFSTVYYAVNGLGNGSVSLANVSITGGTVSGNTTFSNVTISSVASTFPNNYLSNSSVTVGNTAVALGSTVTSFGNVTLTNTTISSVATTFPNNYLSNTSVTLGNTALTLGSTVTSVGNATVANVTVTNYIETAPSLTNSSTAVTLSLTSGTVLSYTLTGNCTFTMPTATSGTSFILKLIQDSTGSRTATFTGVKWPGGTAPTITTTASTGLDILSFVCINGTWYGSYLQAFA
jgi:hypothetical protein